MSRMTRQFLRIVMVAVAVFASSLNGYLVSKSAFAISAHDTPAMQHHGHDLGGQDLHAHDGHAQSCTDADCDEPSHVNHVCTHVHASCCGSLAVPTGECGLKLSLQSRVLKFDTGAYLPLGQHSYPLFRPPRATA